MKLVWSIACLALAATAPVPAAPLAPPLDSLAFLVGDWRAEQDGVADTGGTVTGRSSFTIEAGGHALLRRDHIERTRTKGWPTGGSDQIMLVYSDAGAIRADYSDSTHVIHYQHVAIEPGKSVSFIAQATPDAPIFRLRYSYRAPATLTVDFAMAPARGGALRSIASGILTRVVR